MQALQSQEIQQMSAQGQEKSGRNFVSVKDRPEVEFLT